MAPSLIPPSVDRTVNGYIGYLAEEINRAWAHWDHFCTQVSAAYSDAYDLNGSVLGHVKNRKIERKAADEAAMSFVLSLLTVGVAGAAAGPIAEKILDEGVAQNAAKDIVKQVMKTAGGYVSGVAVDALSPERGADSDVFAPSDVKPIKYMLGIR